MGFVLRQASPSCGGRDACAEAVEEESDFGNREACSSSKLNYGQAEFGVGRKTPLAALPGSARKDANFLIKTNCRGADAGFTCQCTDFHIGSHFSLDLKCALTINIFTCRPQEEIDGHEETLCKACHSGNYPG